jgi:hypothetical protein
MAKRLVAAVAVMAGAAVALMGAAAPLAAQTYPPPQNSITVDDATPAPGQSITVTLRTCRPRTVALLGIDLLLVAAPRVGSDGVARATVTVPRLLRAGRHTVSGVCLTPDGRPLFLRTTIVVTPASGGGGGGGAGGGVGTAGGPGGGGTGGQPAAAPASSPGASSAAAPLAAGATGGGDSGGPGADLSLTALDGPRVPDDAPALFEEAAEANGVTEDGGSPGSAAARPSNDGAANGGSEPGPLATVARVVLGAAALGGVPVALAISRRPPRVARDGFRWPQPSRTA